MHKHSILFTLRVILVGFIYGCNTNGKIEHEIILTNTSSLTLTDKAIAIERSRLPNIPKGTVYPLVISTKGDTIPAQLDDLNGDDKWDELFFVANLSSHEENTYTIKWVKSKPQFVKLTSIRFGKRSAGSAPIKPATRETLYAKELPKSLGFQRYQTDGPSWENDKVGFRDYLDGRNSKDVFGKLISRMTPENVGISAAGEVEDNYHVMEDWGRDILAVGNSVGIGGIAMMKNGNLMRLGVTSDDSINNIEKTVFHIVSEGPVRSILDIKYYNWKPEQTVSSYNVQETISIWPGMYAYHNSVKVSGLEGNENLLVGIVNINAEKAPREIKVNDKWLMLISHEKHSYNKEWWLGLSLIVPADAYLGYVQAPKTGNLSNTYLAKLKVKNGVPVNYFAVAAWELSDERFKIPSYFENYVQNLAKKISAEVKVIIR